MEATVIARSARVADRHFQPASEDHRLPVQQTVTYEQPLNERVRTLLRLEFLFRQTRYSLSGHTEWDSRAALAGIIDILTVIARGDIKTEFIKEIDRQLGALARLDQTPGVDRGKLESVLHDLEGLSDRLLAHSGQIGQELKQNDFISGIRQRMSITGGTCDFDLPTYHYWLQQPVEIRVRDLERWFKEFEAIHLATNLTLRLIRESSLPTQEVATGGFYQRTLGSNIPCQLLRVTVPKKLPYFPEISGGKHRFTVRFMAPNIEQRPTQAPEDVEFQLTCCVL